MSAREQLRKRERYTEREKERVHVIEGGVES